MGLQFSSVASLLPFVASTLKKSRANPSKHPLTAQWQGDKGTQKSGGCQAQRDGVGKAAGDGPLCFIIKLQVRAHRAPSKRSPAHSLWGQGDVRSFHPPHTQTGGAAEPRRAAGGRGLPPARSLPIWQEGSGSEKKARTYQGCCQELAPVMETYLLR